MAARAPYIDLAPGERIAVLYEDRSVLALDKPAGWLLAPDSWSRTRRNLQTVLESGIAAREFWARSRNLKFLRFIHRLDAETSGVVLFARSPGAVRAYSLLFESRRMEKIYLAVVNGSPREPAWESRQKLSPDPAQPGRMKVDARHGKPAETRFRVLQTHGGRCLLEVRPLTGRTHQIRVHLREAGCPVLGDPLYSEVAPGSSPKMALRAVYLAYVDPFTQRPVTIRAPNDGFLRKYGFDPDPIENLPA